MSVTVDSPRCWSCQAFVSPDRHDADGYYCPNCGDNPHADELELNGYEFDEDAGIWVSA